MYTITTGNITEFINSKDKEIRTLKQEYEAEESLRLQLAERFEAQVRLTKKREERIKSLKQLLEKAVGEIEACNGGRETLLTKEIREKL